MKDVSNRDMHNVNKQFIFTTLDHLIVAKSGATKPGVKANYPLISFTTKENGSMICLMELEGKFTAKTPITMANLCKGENKAWGFTIGIANSIFQVIS